MDHFFHVLFFHTLVIFDGKMNFATNLLLIFAHPMCKTRWIIEIPLRRLCFPPWVPPVQSPNLGSFGKTGTTMIHEVHGMQ